MRRLRALYKNPEDYIDRLENDLFFARTSILRLVKEPFRTMLNEFYCVKSQDDANDWERNIAQRIIDKTEPLENRQNRAYCPLCGAGSTSPYAQGFSLEDGLHRHLIGTHNVTQCIVMTAVIKLSYDCWEDTFQR